MMTVIKNGMYTFCPNGNHWKDVTGWCSKRAYLYCECDKCKGAVYELRPINVTKSIDRGTLKSLKKRMLHSKVLGMINYKNMESVLQFLQDEVDDE